LAKKKKAKKDLEAQAKKGLKKLEDHLGKFIDRLSGDDLVKITTFGAGIPIFYFMQKGALTIVEDVVIEGGDILLNLNPFYRMVPEEKRPTITQMWNQVPKAYLEGLMIANSIFLSGMAVYHGGDILKGIGEIIPL